MQSRWDGGCPAEDDGSRLAVHDTFLGLKLFFHAYHEGYEQGLCQHIICLHTYLLIMQNDGKINELIQQGHQGYQRNKWVEGVNSMTWNLGHSATW